MTNSAVPTDLLARQQVEIDFWRNDAKERPGVDDIDNFLDKCGDAQLLRECLRPYDAHLKASKRVLELGAGQAWGSCFVKRLYPHLHVTATDISPYAVQSVGRWERAFGSTLDHTAACTSTAIPVDAGSLDFVFCFSAAHHFVTHRRTLKELARVLRPGGKCAYFYEPSCTPWLYESAVRRVNAKRPEVPEDVLIRSKMESLASEAGLSSKITLWPSTSRRGPVAAVYYSLLSVSGPIKHWLPCTANFEFTRPLH